MKFSVVCVIVPEENEERAIDKVKEAGAAGVTLLKARGIGLNEKKTFFGLSFERNESMLLCVVEKSVGLKILKYIKKELNLDSSGNGIAFSMGLEHLVGINYNQINKFENERVEDGM